MSMRNILYHYSNIITILLDSNKKGHHGMGLHKRPTVGSGAVAAGTYANGNSSRQNTLMHDIPSQHTLPTSLSDLTRVGGVDLNSGTAIYVDKNGQRYVVHAASFSQNPSEQEKFIQAQIITDGLYKSLFSNNNSLKVNMPESATFLHDGKLCKITKEIILQKNTSTQVDTEIQEIQKKLIGIHSLIGFSGEDQPSLLRAADGSICFAQTSYHNKWTTDNVMNDFPQRTKLKDVKHTIESLQQLSIDLYAQRNNILDKKPPFLFAKEKNAELDNIFRNAMYSIKEPFVIDDVKLLEPKHYKAIEDTIKNTINEQKTVVMNNEKKIQYLNGENVDISMLETWEQGKLKYARENNEAHLLVYKFEKEISNGKKTVEFLTSEDFNNTYSDWKKQRVDWSSKFSEVNNKLKQSILEYQDNVDQFQELIKKINPISEQRRMIDEKGIPMKTPNEYLKIGLGDGIDELFGSVKNLSPDEVFSTITLAKQNALAAKTSMMEHITKSVSDPTERQAMLFKLDKRIESLDRLDTVYQRMLSDKSVEFNKDYLLDFGKHYQGITSDLIAEKYFDTSIKYFNLNGERISEFSDSNQKSFIQASNIDREFRIDSPFRKIFDVSNATTCVRDGAGFAVSDYMFNSGLGVQEARKSSQSARLVDDWTQSQGDNSVKGLAGGVRLGFVDQIMKYDENSVTWGKSQQSSAGDIGKPMTKLDFMLDSFYDKNILDTSKISMKYEDIQKLLRSKNFTKAQIDAIVDDVSKGLKTGLHTDIGDGLTVQHALTYALLENIAAPNHDKTTGTVSLYRSESDRRILEALKNSDVQTGSDATGSLLNIQRGLTDSFSAFAPISVGNPHITIQEVPFHRVLGTFTGKQYNTNENNFYGVTELEYLVMPVGLKAQYMGVTETRSQAVLDPKHDIKTVVKPTGVSEQYPPEYDYFTKYEQLMKKWRKTRPNPYNDGYLPESQAPTFQDLSFIWDKQ